MSLTFMKNKYIDLSISFCYLVCLFLQNICLYFAQIFSKLGIHLKWIGNCPDNNADNAISMGVYATDPLTGATGDWGILIVFTNGDAKYDRWVFQFWLSTKGAINRRYNINSEGWTTWAEL